MDSSWPELLVLPLRDLEVLLEDDLRIGRAKAAWMGFTEGWLGCSERWILTA